MNIFTSQFGTVCSRFGRTQFGTALICSQEVLENATPGFTFWGRTRDDYKAIVGQIDEPIRGAIESVAEDSANQLTTLATVKLASVLDVSVTDLKQPYIDYLALYQIYLTEQKLLNLELIRAEEDEAIALLTLFMQ